ncbi:MAG: hypothetical protein EOO77_34785 [Oxalobacteraceae bacterium]|nr:MAG: hypothetical protein EOO77_34785 [Oxalobacteraceae bacterium]
MTRRIASFVAVFFVVVFTGGLAYMHAIGAAGTPDTLRYTAALTMLCGFIIAVWLRPNEDAPMDSRATAAAIVILVSFLISGVQYATSYFV